MKKASRAAVILVHYEDYAHGHFEHCYRDLQSQSLPKDRFTVFIVNNGAPDETDRFVRTLSPDARHLNNGNNTGWAHANNLAIKVALQEGYEYIVLLNMDTQLDKDWLFHLVRGADESASSDIIQSKIMLHGTDRINSMGNRTHFLGYGYCLGFGKTSWSAADSETIDFASGASMLVKSEVFHRAGLFEEEYFMYYDDMEFCWRARLAGFTVSLEPRSVCYHKYNFPEKMNFLYHLEKNRLLTLLTLAKKRSLALIALALISAQTASGAYFILKGYAKEIGALYLFFGKKETWRYIFEKRARIKKLRLCSDRAIVRKFSPEDLFPAIESRSGVKAANLVLSLYWKIFGGFIFW